MSAYRVRRGASRDYPAEAALRAARSGGGVCGMSQFFRTSTVWVIDFRFDGRARRWLRAFPAHADVEREVREQLLRLHGDRAVLAAVRRATDEEQAQFLRGESPPGASCPTGRR